MAHLSGHIENVNEVVEHDVSTEELLPHLWDTKLVTRVVLLQGYLRKESYLDRHATDCSLPHLRTEET